MKQILNLPDAIRLPACWRLWLSEFDLDTVHREGVKNKAVDSLSRLEDKGENNKDIKIYMLIDIIDHYEDRNERSKVQPFTVRHIFEHKNHEPGTMMPEVRALVGQAHRKWERPPTLPKCIAAQGQDPTCQWYTATIGHSEPRFHVDSNALLVRQSTGDGSIQTVVLKVFQARIHYQAHHTSFAGHNGRRRMYDLMGLEYPWA